MATIPGLLDGHVTLEVECLDRLYLNGYIGRLATGGGLIGFMCGRLGKPVPSPVVLGQNLREIPRHGNHKQRKDDIANEFRRQRQVRDGIVFIGVAQEKAQAFNGKKVNGQFHFDRDKTVYVNHYYFYIDDADLGPILIKVQVAPRVRCRRRSVFQHLIDGFSNRDFIQQVADLLGVTLEQYTTIR